MVGRTAIAWALVAVGLAACGDDAAETAAGTESGGTASGGAASTGTEGTGGDSSVGGGGQGGSGQLGAEPWLDGSRIRMVVEDGGDGARLPYGWVDDELGAGCSIVEIEGAGLRCAYTVGATFSDASCAQPILVEAQPYCGDPAPPTPATVAMAAAPNAACGPTPYRVYAVGAVSTVETLYYRDELTGECIEGGRDVSAHALQPGDESALVAFTPEESAIDDGLARLVLRGDDGSAEVRNGIDRARNVACSPYDVGLPCTPSAAYPSGYYDDESCGAQLAQASSCNAVAVAYVDGTCTGTVRFHEIGAEAPTAFAYGDPCYAAGPIPGLRRYGTEIPLTSFPALENVDVGTGRLVARFVGRAGASIQLQYQSFFDTELGLRCYAERFEDGWRCLPYDSTWFSPDSATFADEACTSLMVPEPYDDCDAEDHIFYVRDQSDEACVPAVMSHVGRRVGPHAGPFYALVDGECVETEFSDWPWRAEPLDLPFVQGPWQ